MQIKNTNLPERLEVPKDDEDVQNIEKGDKEGNLLEFACDDTDENDHYQLPQLQNVTSYSISKKASHN